MKVYIFLAKKWKISVGMEEKADGERLIIALSILVWIANLSNYVFLTKEFYCFYLSSKSIQSFVFISN